MARSTRRSNTTKNIARPNPVRTTSGTSPPVPPRTTYDWTAIAASSSASSTAYR